METQAKKVIRAAFYILFACIGFFVALFPFLKNTKDYSVNFSPTVHNVHADIISGGGAGDGDGDGGDGGRI